MPFTRGLRFDSDSCRVTDKLLGRELPSGSDLVLVVTKNRDLWAPPVRDQRRSQFCVRFAGCDAVHHALTKAGEKPALLSPLFAAWNDAMPGDQGANAGTMIYKFAEAAHSVGLASEDSYPFEHKVADDYILRMKLRPPDYAFIEAERHQVLASHRLPDGDPMAIAAELMLGNVCQIGGPVDKGFEDTPLDGIIPAYNKNEFLGLHSYLVVDLDHVGGSWKFVVRNSWSKRWAKNGYAYLPMDAAKNFKDGRVYTAVERILR